MFDSSIPRLVTGLFGWIAITTLTACAGLPAVDSADAAMATTIRFDSPAQFSSKASGCRYAAQAVRRKAISSCEARALSVDRDSCACESEPGSGGKVRCTIEARVACQ